MNEWLALPREWIAASGEIAGFSGKIIGDVYSLRVLRFFGETLRQAGILIISSTLIIWSLMFILGLQCGIQGAYFTEASGAPAYSGVFTAWCDLREIIPYAFGYMMSAKVGTGIVAELGAMRISDEIDALEVMGIDSLTFLCATRLLAAWMVLPFMYLAGIGGAFLASYIAVVASGGGGVLRRLLPDLLAVPEPPRLPLQPDQGDGDGHRDRAGRLLLRLQRLRRPRRGWYGHGQVDGHEYRARTRDRNVGHPDLLGGQPARPDRRVSMTMPVYASDRYGRRAAAHAGIGD